jgi:geranylgeranyl pyrophosphate synthase
VQTVVRGAFAHGGKRIRPTIALLVGQLVGAPEDKLMALAASVETLHAATLIHDDLIDQSLIRRGHATLNASLSAETTVLAGDYLFARAAAFAAETGSPRVVSIFAECLMTICGGELGQLTGRRRTPTREEYLKRIYSKTAALFAAAAEGAAVLGRTSESETRTLRQYGEDLGMAFQIIDDILDFTSDEAALGKPVGSDLRQGTVTLPALYASANDGVLLDRALSGDKAAAEAVIATVRESDASAMAQADARQYAASAIAALAWFPPGSARGALEGLADFTVSRVA